MFNKKQLKFLKYVSKPRKRLDAMKKFPKTRENQSIYDLNFSKYFDRLPNDCFQINDAGLRILEEHSNNRFSSISSLFGFIWQIIEKLLKL